MQLIVVSGLSGSGKSVALKALEDLGYTCVDNLPALFLAEWSRLCLGLGESRIAASVDVRGRQMLDTLPGQLEQAERLGLDVRLLFLEASDESLLRRFSETRRSHPLSSGKRTVPECIAAERHLLEGIAPLGHHIDTSRLPTNTLRQWVRQFTDVDQSQLTLIFQSFGFKYGVPQDSDFVFDVRCLPNPFYDPALKPLTGRDAPVADFLRATPEPMQMLADIQQFIERWLPSFVQDNRNFVTVSIGCTGGQHRSVFFAEQLGAHFSGHRLGQVLIRHREIPV